MRTPDPFLRHLWTILDRATVWSLLAFLLTALAWSGVWDRGLGLPLLDGWQVLGSVLAGRNVERLPLTLLALCLAFGAMGATLVGGWLFRRWQRRAELDVVRLRGARWEGDQ